MPSAAAFFTGSTRRMRSVGTMMMASTPGLVYTPRIWIWESVSSLLDGPRQVRLTLPASRTARSTPWRMKVQKSWSRALGMKTMLRSRAQEQAEVDANETHTHRSNRSFFIV